MLKGDRCVLPYNFFITSIRTFYVGSTELKRVERRRPPMFAVGVLSAIVFLGILFLIYSFAEICRELSVKRRRARTWPIRPGSSRTRMQERHFRIA